MVNLSIIILNYNAKDFAIEAVKSIEKNYPKEISSGTYEVILCDNSSSDGSLKAFKAYKKKSKIKVFYVIDTGGNIGFAAGNNKGVPYAKGKYILFLNPDTLVYQNTLTAMVKFMEEYPDAGAATCKVEIPNGDIDEGSHRGFPTPWNAFTHFSGLERIFPHSRLFAGYKQGWQDMETIHEVDAIVGAFMIMPRKIGEQVGWWDEDYFFYGEDIQFCYNIKKLGYKIYYVPTASILHYGGVSSGIRKQSQNITTANIEVKRKVQNWRFDAMKIFYKKNYANKYPKIVTWLVFAGIEYLRQRNIPKINMKE